jgi:serine/threonine protein kinase
MKALAEGIAWLESLGLAHGDLRPENILVNEQDHVKVADFDCTDLIGSKFEACIPPYGRLLGSEASSEKGSAGKLGARTEQFALGSLFYYINYGTEVYDDQNFGKDHGPVVVERLQEMIFPKLNTTLMSDLIIDAC